MRWRPRIGLATDFATGDKNAANPDLQTFNSLFQSGQAKGNSSKVPSFSRDNAATASRSCRISFGVMMLPHIEEAERS